IELQVVNPYQQISPPDLEGFFQWGICDVWKEAETAAEKMTGG
nr:hypothetical protein [Tanacetum cinerariifolium]